MGSCAQVADKLQKAVVALARKLAVLMHAIWKKGAEFETKVAQKIAGTKPAC